jgi:hypothetical protein
LPVPDSEDAQDVEFEEVTSNLSEGLRTCRSVVQSYRLLLVGDQPAVSGHSETPAAVNDDVSGNGEPVQA